LVRQLGWQDDSLLGLPLTRVRGGPLAGAALGFGDLLGGHAGREGVANPDRPLTSTSRTTNCDVSVVTTTRS